MKIGDRVYFGAYGQFDNARVWTIQDINYNKTLQCNTYNLYNKDDSHLMAYENEIIPIN